MLRDLLILNANEQLNSDDLLMMCGSFPDRIEVAHPINPENPITWSIAYSGHFHNSGEPQDYQTAKNMYAKYLYNEAISQNQTMSAFLAIYGLSKLYQTQFVWSRPPLGRPFARELERILQTITDKFFPHIYKYDFSGISNLHFNDTCYQPDQHCNDLGHQIYFERVIMPFMNTLGIN